MQYTARLTGTIEVEADTLEEAQAKVAHISSHPMKDVHSFGLFPDGSPVLANVRIDDPDNEAERTALMEAAREKYALRSSDDIEIDDDARVSQGDTGAFVQAWVHVTNEEAGLPDFEDGERP